MSLFYHCFTKARSECIIILPYGPPNHRQILTKCFPKGRGGTPWALSTPKRPKSTQELPKRPPDHQKASQRASGSPLEALWGRLERFWNVLQGILRGDFEIKFGIDSGNADFLKSMLSPKREHRFWSPEGPKMEPKSLPKRSCEAKRAKEERQSA